MTISKLYSRVKSMDIEKISTESLTETSDKRIEANREQMSTGLDATGDIIGYYSSRQYAAYKQAIGSQAPYGIVDLKLTRDFQKGLRSDVNNNIIKNYSTDSKALDLEGRYGGDIYGTGGQYKIEYIKNDLRPAFNGKIEKAIGLKLSK